MYTRDYSFADNIRPVAIENEIDICLTKCMFGIVVSAIGVWSENTVVGDQVDDAY